MESFVGKPINGDLGQIFINPGTGPISEATQKNARANITQLLLDAGLDPEQVKVTHIAEWNNSGRYFYKLDFENRICEVLMPGLELERVRYMDSETQDIWHFPRLYIDGSSWVWMLAIDFVRSDLSSNISAEQESQ